MYLLGSILVLRYFEAGVHENSGPARIVGGSVAPDKEYPYQVSFRNATNRREYLCSGSILNDHWILTAAHCIKGRALKDLVISAGTNYLDVAGDIYKPSLFVINENYQSFSNYDIGLIRVAGKIVFNNRVKSIRLPDEDLTHSRYSAMFAGWGRTQYDEPISNELREITLRVLTVEDCAMSSTTIDYTHICTYNKINESICLGDSGGPLTVGDVQVGIASYFWSCTGEYPVVFTRVFAYKDWINNKMTLYDIYLG